MINRDVAFVDYETFWDAGFSLRSPKISTTDYIHDPRFDIHGASCARRGERPMWLHTRELQSWLNEARNDGCIFAAHHTLFDGYIAMHHNKLEFDDYFCTMGLIEALFQGAVGRGLDEAMTTLLGWESGKSDILTRTKGMYWPQMNAEEKEEMSHYACKDLEACMELFEIYSPMLPPAEWKIMSTTLKMFCQPRLEFNSKLLVKALTEAQDDRDERIENAMTYFNCTEDDLRKSRFLELIESCGVPVPMKPSPSVEGKMIPALAKTDQGFHDLLEHEDPRIVALAEGRLAVKSTQGITRAQRFIDLDMSTGNLPVAYNYYRAHTGRPSGGNKINLTNLKRGSNLRKSIVAPKGFVLGVGDSGQIECRDNAYISGQESLLDLFRSKGDPYNDMASTIFGRTIDRKYRDKSGKYPDFMEGFLGKTAILGLGYQMGGPKFKYSVEMGAKTQLGIDYSIELNEAYRIVDIYRSKNYKIKEMWDRAESWLYRMVQNDDDFEYDYGDGKLVIQPKANKILFPNGTHLYYPCLDYHDGSFTYVKKLGKNYVNSYIYGGKLIENIIQKHSRDIVMWQMLNICEQLHVVLQTYDEVVALLERANADEDLAWMLNQMTLTPPWAKSLPLAAEGGWAEEYSK